MDLKYTKSTDTKHKVTLESHLITAFWWPQFAPAGSTIKLQVETSFVGNGAPVKITGKSEEGKSAGKTNGKMRNNKFVGELEIPATLKIGDYVYFEVKLSKNGISGQSNKIPVVPPIKVTNMKWSESVARRGDVVTLSADIKGVREGTDALVTIYEYDRDNAHDKIVELPAHVENSKIKLDWEYEYHEDTDEIPTEEELQQYGKNYNPPEYFFTIKINDQEFGKKQESGILEFKDWIEIVLEDHAGEPIPDEDYVLYLPDGKERKGKLDSNGFAREKDVPPGRFEVEFPNV